jgi:hypothetical protein
MSVAAAVLVGATVYWATHSELASQVERLAQRESHPAMDGIPGARTAQADIAPPLTGVQTSSADPEASTVAQYTSEKYQFLLDDLGYLEAGQIAQLREALQLRERLVGEHESAGQKEALARAEDQIRGILRPADHATYEMLRESDLELFKLNEYAGGISNVAPLSAADRETILKTKLAYKACFRQLVRDAGFERGDLSAAEREYAYAVASRALEDFRRSYLQEVRQYLANEEQYALLSNYEATEFKAELAQLQSLANTSDQGGS